MIKDNIAKLSELAGKYGGAEKLVEKLIKVGELKAKKKMIPVILGVALASSALSAGLTLLLADQALKQRDKYKKLKEAKEKAADKIEDAGEAIGSAAEDAADAVEGVVEDAAEKVEDVVEKIEDKAE